MPRQNTQFDFGDTKEPKEPFVLYEKIITDRGSVYSVSLGRVKDRQAIKNFLATLKQNKHYAKATHNSWAARIRHEGAIFEAKRDDGELGAGQIILRVMQRHNVSNGIICVTRWFGGTKLMSDRFKHIEAAATLAVARLD